MTSKLNIELISLLLHHIKIVNNFVANYIVERETVDVKRNFMKLYKTKNI